MTTKKNSKTIKTKKQTEKNIKKAESEVGEKKKTVLQKAVILQKNIKLKKEDRMLEKVEKYVDKNREKTSQDMIERKSKRPIREYQEWDLEVMISRISVESKPKKDTRKISKGILYIIYLIIIIIILILMVKYFFAWNMPQIS